MTIPLVSIVVTTYNRPEFLESAIESALCQTHSNVEVIVIDDCSTENISSIIEKFGSRILYHRQRINSGISEARNKGILLAKGDYIAFLDDDDRFFPQKIERQFAALSRGYEACLCGWQILGADRVLTLKRNEIDEAYLRWGNLFLNGSGLLCRKSVIEQIMFDPSLPYAEDWDVNIAFARRRPIAYVAEPLYYFRRGTSHAGLTGAAKTMSPDEMQRRTAAVQKQREWLGEIFYRYRIAAISLVFIAGRKDKVSVLRKALKNAGILGLAMLAYIRIYSRFKLRFAPRVRSGGAA